MSAAAAWERKMPGEDRIASLESGMKHVISTVGSLDNRVQGLADKVDAVGSDLNAFKTEAAKAFGAVRVEIANLRTDMIERLGNLKIWLLLTAAGTAGSLISMFLNIASLIHGWKSP